MNLGQSSNDVVPTALRVSAQLAVVEELLPALKNAHFIRTWSGTEGYLPDRQPVLGKSRTTPGLIHGFGFAGAGFQLGPGVGEVLAELARDDRSTTPIDAFAIERFVTKAVAEVASTATAQ